MNKRQAKKAFRKCVNVFPQGRIKHGIWVKKETRLYEKELLKLGCIEKAN